MNEQEIQDAIKQKQDEYGRNANKQAEVFNQYNPANDPVVNTLRGQQSEKLKELFAHDQQLADVYTTGSLEAPGPHNPGYTPPAPRLVDPTIGLRASSVQTQATAAEVGDILRLIETRKDTLNTERDKSLKMLQSIIDANKNEQASLAQQMGWLFEERRTKVAERAGTDEGMSWADFLKIFNKKDEKTNVTQNPKEAPTFAPRDPKQVVAYKGKRWKYNIQKGIWEEVEQKTSDSRPPLSSFEQ